MRTRLAAVAALAVALTACSGGSGGGRSEATPTPSGDLPVSRATTGPTLLTNGDFSDGLSGWSRTSTAGTSAVTPVTSGYRGTGAQAVAASTIEQQARTALVPAGTQLRAGVRVKAGEVGRTATLVVEERAPDGALRSRVQQSFRAYDASWHHLRTTALSTAAGSRWVLQVRVGSVRASRPTLLDEATLAVVANPDLDVAASAPRLSNGCAVSSRGVPLCSAFIGGAYGGNTAPERWERTLDGPLGLRRTYYDASEIAKAAATARADLRAGRLPWISFKAPRSWSAMSLGLGDAWARRMARELATLPGPVWVAIHHEPEQDGDIRAWTAMQRRLAPLVRREAPNAAYTIILTGYQQVLGEKKYHLDSLWPRNTEIDVVGFDVYNLQGTRRDGRYDGARTPLEDRYFVPLSAWAREHGVAWAVGETGYTRTASRQDPRWVLRTYQQVVEHGGVAFAYFNSDLNSIARWSLHTPRKNAQFRAAYRLGPRL